MKKLENIALPSELSSKYSVNKFQDTYLPKFYFNSKHLIFALTKTKKVMSIHDRLCFNH